METTACSVLFDRGPLENGSLFREPETIVEIWSPDDLPTAFRQLEAAQANGKWLAGYASYELGYALISKLAPKLPLSRKEPLLQFGIFPAPHAPAERGDNGFAKLDPFKSQWSFDQYNHAFDTIQRYIAAGDIYQANLTFPLQSELTGSPYALYHGLRTKQPVPHGALVDLGGNTLLSRSPELFFSMSKDGRLRARPMKGTIRRGRTQDEDEALKGTLLASEKDRAENLMITDLLRNDLGRISRIGSVRVPNLFAIESYATVHQMTSEIVSQISTDVGLTDIFTALFPCGSVTGAPKIRAMEIIAEVEDTPRGSYCGAIGWIAPDGSMEFNVTIRTLICAPSGEVTLNVGGGIVHDSTAQSEFEEALLKARFASGLSAS